MPRPAARTGDAHTCPASTPTAHVGGPILGPGVPTVRTGGAPAAIVGDVASCAGPSDTCVTGSRTVWIGGRPAARLGDRTAHGGVIASGLSTVLLGD